MSRGRRGASARLGALLVSGAVIAACSSEGSVAPGGDGAVDDGAVDQTSADADWPDACASDLPDVVAAEVPDGSTWPTLDATDTDGIELFCATAGACELGYGSFGDCVAMAKSYAMVRAEWTTYYRDERRAWLRVARCAAAARGDCPAIAACVLGPVVREPRCCPIEGTYVASVCDGDRLLRCSLGPHYSPGVAAVSDCASAWEAGGSVGGPHCTEWPTGGLSARCAIGPCADSLSSWTTCSGTLFVSCSGGVLTAQRCATEGKVCTGRGCMEEAESCPGSPLACDGKVLLEVCSDGGSHPAADCSARPGYSCDAFGGIDHACTPIGAQCSDGAPATCEGRVLHYCADGWPRDFDCAVAGFPRCAAGPVATCAR